jgi:hypothetical protein
MKEVITEPYVLRQLVCSGITEHELNRDYNTSQLKNLGGVFMNCHDLVKAPLFDTSGVTNMGSMFSGCRNLKEFPNYNTKNVENVSLMFSKCENLKEVPAMQFPKLKFMSNTFEESGIEELPKWDFASNTSHQDVFLGCDNLHFDMKTLIEKYNYYEEYENISRNFKNNMKLKKTYPEYFM